jgi:hypothetical protein
VFLDKRSICSLLTLKPFCLICNIVANIYVYSSILHSTEKGDHIIEIIFDHLCKDSTFHILEVI